MKHLKITSVLLSAAICMSFVMTPVSVIADETEASEQTTEATEAPETKETEATKETEKAKEPEVTEPSESVSETTETEPSVQNKEDEETAHSESDPETTETEPSESETEPSTEEDKQEPEKEAPVPEESKPDSASRSAKNDEEAVSGKCGANLTWTYTVSEWGGTVTIEGSGDMYNYKTADEAPWYVYRDELHYVRLSNNVTSVGDYAFCDAKLWSVIWSPKLKRIGNYAFANKTNMSDPNLPKTLTTIGEGAFENNHIHEITIPYSVTSIGKRAFADTWLSCVVIPAGVKNIPDSLFDSCKNLYKVTLLNGVTTINNAFSGCLKLKYITIPKSVTTIKAEAFSDCSALKTVEYGGSASDWKKIKIGSSNEYLINAERQYSSYIATGILGTSVNWTLDKSGKLTVSGTGEIDRIGSNSWKYMKDSIKTVVIENGITSIPYQYFAQYINLTSVQIADTVETIGEECFSDCPKLTSVKLPTGLKKIERKTFNNCPLLKNTKLPDGITEIGSGAFMDCKSLTSMVIPEGVTVIGESAFNNCIGITSFGIPKSVTEIGESIINGCDELNDIHYGGTQDDWFKIKKGMYNFNLWYVGIYFSDGTYMPCQKISNTLKVKTKTAKVKYKKLRNKAQTVSRSKVLTVSDAVGNLKYTLVSVKKSKYKKYFKINATTGTVTIKKKLRRGTYKIKCKVKAVGNYYTKGMTRTVTFKIKVK